MSSSGVISEPPPTPVSPTRMPTPSPNRMMTGSTVRSEGGWRASAASRTPRATRRSRDGREDRAPVRWARSGWAERQRVALGRSAVPFAGGPADPDAIRAAIRGGAAGPAPRHPRVEPAVRTPRASNRRHGHGGAAQGRPRGGDGGDPRRGAAAGGAAVQRERRGRRGRGPAGPGDLRAPARARRSRHGARVVEGGGPQYYCPHDSRRL